MSSSLYLNLISNASTNPNNNTPNSSGIFDDKKLSVYVERIQRMTRVRDIKRSAKKMKETMESQTYRIYLVEYLSTFISTGTCVKLLFGSEDDEVLVTSSPYDRAHATLKATHIADALKTLIQNTFDEKAITWLECCELAVNKNYNKIKRARTVADWYLQLHETESLQFKRSDRGRASYFAKSPFSEDESLMVQFKSWCRVEIEHLTVKKT